jgi:hypothetical protein
MILTSPAATLIICGVKLAPEAQATNSPAHHQRSCLRNEIHGILKRMLTLNILYSFC